jgi:hypothetical protein
MVHKIAHFNITSVEYFNNTGYNGDGHPNSINACYLEITTKTKNFKELN